MRALPPIIAALVALTAPHAALGAGVVVHFADGRALEVEAVEPDGDMTFLAMHGGGELAVPSARIARWEDARAPRTQPRPAPPPVPRRHDAWRRAAGPYADLILRVCDEHALDPALLTAMAQVESAFDARAVSPKGAGGLLQLMPDTAARFGVEDVFDPAQNVEGGARYMRWLLERFDGDTRLALAGYNAGEGAVDRHAGVPPYRETRDYVARVLRGFDRLALR